MHHSEYLVRVVLIDGALLGGQCIAESSVYHVSFNHLQGVGVHPAAAMSFMHPCVCLITGKAC